MQKAVALVLLAPASKNLILSMDLGSSQLVIFTVKTAATNPNLFRNTFIFSLSNLSEVSFDL